jgi:nicotinate-nucleotide--dimethylbenzimidazole phosphoribosyltransferase
LPGPEAGALADANVRLENLALRDQARREVADIVGWLAGWQGQALPKVEAASVALFAATHNAKQFGLSDCSDALTSQRVSLAAAGGGPVNEICRSVGAGLRVLDLALQLPTVDTRRGPAMDEKLCAGTIAFGMEAASAGGDLLCLGDMSEGGDVLAAAVCSSLLGLEPSRVAPTDRFAQIIGEMLAAHALENLDPLEILRRLGGRDIAATMGAIIAARTQNLPVLLDGYVAIAAAVVLQRLGPGAVDHCRIAVSGGPGQSAVLDLMGMAPILGHGGALGGSLGEGASAALAIPHVRAIADMFGGMATKTEADMADRG